MHSRGFSNISVRMDRFLAISQRHKQTLVLLLFTILCIIYVLYRLLFASSVYQQELQAAENIHFQDTSVYNLNHHVPDRTVISLLEVRKDDKINSQNNLRTAENLLSHPLAEEYSFNPNDIFHDWLPPLGAQSIPNVDTSFYSDIDTVFVIPGGGSGLPLFRSGEKSANYSLFEKAGYPEWTRRRTSAAFAHYNTLTLEQQQRSVFLALSAGSLNAPNVLFEDRRVMFECQHTLQHLAALGIDKKRLFGDWFSWDTVTNAVALRNFLDGILLFRGPEKLKQLQVLVFISDFHHHRMRQAISWILALHPQPLIGTYSDSQTNSESQDFSQKKHDQSSRSNLITANKSPGSGSNIMKGRYVEVVMQVVDSLGLSLAEDANAWKKRMDHEEAGVQQIKRQQMRITNMRQMQAFLFLGGHKGIQNYLLQEYQPSSGAGW